MATIKQQNTTRQVDLRDEVIRILGITRDDYYQIQFSTAEQFMMRQTQDNQELVSEFLKEPLFWSWWRNQYTMVDEYFATMYGDYRVENPVMLYTNMHTDVKCYPDRMLWTKIQDSYMSTISNIIKSKTNGSQVSPGAH